jgi:hypothetical protein
VRVFALEIMGEPSLRICVLGTSSSAGSGLPREVAWPWLGAAELGLERAGLIEMEHVTLFPVGARAVSFAMAKVEELDPDLVVFAFGSYPCAIATVGQRIKRRYGERAFKAYHRLELKLAARPGNTVANPTRMNRWGRWLVRRVIGAETINSLDDVSGILSDALHQLSRREGTHVLVFSEPDWPKALERDSKDANNILRGLRDRMQAVAKEHRFPYVDCTARFDVPDRDALYLSDAVHKSVAGHRIQADVFLEAMRQHFPATNAERVSATV